MDCGCSGEAGREDYCCSGEEAGTNSGMLYISSVQFPLIETVLHSVVTLFTNSRP